MIELVAGGARSGKSAYAVGVAESFPGNHILVATATAKDAAMAQRIAIHQAERSARWQLIEAPLDLAVVISAHDADDIVLVDCLTLWLTNWRCKPAPSAPSEAWLEQWLAQKQAFLASLQQTKSSVFLVTNEVGMGVVPIGAMSRDFVDHAGWLHQAIAAIANKVTMVTFGLPQVLKNRP